MHTREKRRKKEKERIFKKLQDESIRSEMELIPIQDVPKNMEDCFKYLDMLISDEDKKNILSINSQEFSITQHFGLGLFIRNNFRLHKGNYELCQSLYGHYDFMFFDPDSISGDIVKEYYKHVSGENCHFPINPFNRSYI